MKIMTHDPINFLTFFSLFVYLSVIFGFIVTKQLFYCKLKFALDYARLDFKSVGYRDNGTQIYIIDSFNISD